MLPSVRTVAERHWTRNACGMTHKRGPPVGKFYDLIQQHIDDQPYPVSVNQIARRLEVTPTTLKNWRTPKKLIEKRHVVAVSQLVGVRYERARDALLEDIGWDVEDGPEGGASGKNLPA